MWSSMIFVFAIIKNIFWKCSMSMICFILFKVFAIWEAFLKVLFTQELKIADRERIKELVVVLGGERCVGSWNDEEDDGGGVDASSPSPVFCPLG